MRNAAPQPAASSQPKQKTHILDETGRVACKVQRDVSKTLIDQANPTCKGCQWELRKNAERERIAASQPPSDAIVSVDAGAIAKAEDDTLSSSCDPAAMEEIGHVTVSCPDKDGLAKFNLEVFRNTVSLDQAEAMSEAELHDGIGLTIARGAAAYRSFCNLMTVVKRRLNEGKVVGGCRTLKAYVERWVMLPDESFDAAIRKVYRAIADDAKDGRRTGRRKAESGGTAEILEHRAETTPEPLPESTPTHVSPPQTKSESAGTAPLAMPALAAQVSGAIAPFSPPATVARVIAEPHEEIQTTVAIVEIEPQPAPATTPTTLTDEQRETLQKEYDALWEEGQNIPYCDRSDEYWTRLEKLEEQLFGPTPTGGAQPAPKHYDLPAYTVTLHAKSITSMKAQLKKLGVEADVKKIVHASSRADRLAEAERNVQDAKATVEELRDELQSWLDNLPENFQSGQKGSELEDAINALEDISNELDGIDFGGVQFPGMY
jgi:hypothetical protein